MKTLRIAILFQFGAISCVSSLRFVIPGFFLYALDSCIDVDVHNKSCEYSGTETSVEPSTRQGNLNGEETCQICVESPARWGYAITMESEKAKYEQMITKYELMKTRYQQMKTKSEQMNAINEENCARCELLHEQIHAKHKRQQKCEWNIVTGLFDGVLVIKDKAEFTEQKPLLKLPTNNPPSACVLQTDEMYKCRISRVRCRLHSRRKREREPEFHTGNLSSCLERQELFDVQPNHTLRCTFQDHLS